MRPLRDDAELRRVGAALAAIFATARRGIESFDEVSLLRGLDETCRVIGVPEADFDGCAKLLDYHYYRDGDCYLGKKQLAEARLLEEKWRPRRYYAAA